MLSLRQCLVPAAFAAALLTLSPLASHAAPTAKDKEDAKAAMGEARIAIGINHFEEAARALRRADELDPSPATKVELADVLMQGGKLIEASQILNLVIDGSPVPPPKVKAQAQKMRDGLEPRIPWIQVKVFGPSQDLTSTTIDGKEIDAENEIPFNPGAHTVGADADGFSPAEKKVNLKEGSHLVVKIKMKKLGSKSKKDPDEDGEDGEGEDGEDGEDGGKGGDTSSSGGGGGGKITAHKLFIPSMIAGGVGVVGLGLGTIFGAMALGTTDELLRKCDDGVCPKTAGNQRLQDKAISQGNVSTAMFVIGGVSLAAGGVLFTMVLVSDPPKGKEKAFVKPWVGLGQAGLYGQF